MTSYKDKIQISVAGEELSASIVTNDIANNFFAHRRSGRMALFLFGLIFLAGIVAFITKAMDGFDSSQRANWGYFAALFAFLLSAAGSAPLVAVGFRMTANHWRRPFARISEIYAVVGLLTIVCLMPLLALLPPIGDCSSGPCRKTLWFTSEYWGVPTFWDFAGLLALVVCGIALLLVSALPDIAQISALSESKSRPLLSKLTKFWTGTQSQWHIHRISLSLLGGFYFILLIGVQTIINVDYVMSLVPGWKDSILPAHQALTGIQAGVASVVIVAFIARTFGGYKKYFPMESFWSISKILLALSLLWAYFWFAEVNTLWYGRMPVEQNILKLVMFESYRLPFALNFSMNFLLPFFILLWNPIRKSVIGPTVASILIVVGSFFMMVRLYVPAFGIQDVTAFQITYVPAAIYPDFLDLIMIAGGISGAVFIYLLSTRIIPILSLWEVKEGLLYQRVRPFLRGEYQVLGKPK
ncbi:hypothetical protein FIM04_03265 [SAR202 cluster bacterium AC-409-J13_OGT_754m]|nr:hypothetical protein [SAR202 cluster bacterium AC-409-J13_OGT_754m]